MTLDRAGRGCACALTTVLHRVEAGCGYCAVLPAAACLAPERPEEAGPNENGIACPFLAGRCSTSRAEICASSKIIKMEQGQHAQPPQARVKLTTRSRPIATVPTSWESLTTLIYTAGGPAHPAYRWRVICIYRHFVYAASYTPA